MPISTDIIPLGTASALPTRTRHLSAVALRREGQVLLFDCGEGTQFRLLRGGLTRGRLDAIFLTHFHGDHFYGLFGLLTSLAMLGRKDELRLVSPEGLREILEPMPGIAEEGLPFPLRYIELGSRTKHEIVYDAPDYYVEARPLRHRVPCFGYRFQEKTRPGRVDVDKAHTLGLTTNEQFRLLKAGKAVQAADGRVVAAAEVVGPPRRGVAFAYVLDTMPCAGAVALAHEADLVLHDATFTEDLAARAAETMHCTARQAAETAHRAGAKHLLLSHFSARYDDPAPLVDEARAVFPATEAAEELKVYRLTPPD